MDADARVSFRPASDQSLLIYFDEKISHAAHQSIRAFLHLLAAAPIAGVRNLHPAYCSLLVDFDPLKTTHAEIERILRGYVARLDEQPPAEPRHFEIPMCYGGEYGPDLNEIARLHGISTDEVVELHSSVAYVVYFLGFVPGFAYLGELPERLRTPRLASPRRSAPAGSVGVADKQTGIYPFGVPGGWRLIGRTPLTMFRAEDETMSLLNVGDIVRFVPVPAEQFADLRAR